MESGSSCKNGVGTLKIKWSLFCEGHTFDRSVLLQWITHRLFLLCKQFSRSKFAFKDRRVNITSIKLVTLNRKYLLDDENW